MTELKRYRSIESLFQLCRRQIGSFRKWQAIPDQEGLSCVHRVMIEQKKGRIHETRQESPSDCEYAMAFAPHNSDIAAKDIGDRVEHQIEMFSFKA